MSCRLRSRAAAIEAKRIALVPLAALDDDRDDETDDECSHCLGDGMDPWNDYMLPCPLCGGRDAP